MEFVGSSEVPQVGGYILHAWVWGMAWMPDDATTVLYSTLHIGDRNDLNTAATDAWVQPFGGDEDACLIEQQFFGWKGKNGMEVVLKDP